MVDLGAAPGAGRVGAVVCEARWAPPAECRCTDLSVSTECRAEVRPRDDAPRLTDISHHPNTGTYLSIGRCKRVPPCIALPRRRPRQPTHRLDFAPGSEEQGDLSDFDDLTFAPRDLNDRS
jgi:hypothetical protein